MEHNEDHVHQGDTIADKDLHPPLEHLDFLLVLPVEALGSLGVQPLQGSCREGGDSLLVPRWHVGHVEPLLLPSFHHFNEFSRKPFDIVELADHGSFTLCDMATTGLWLDTEQLEPEPEVRLYPEECLT